MDQKLGILLVDDERIFGATIKALLQYKAKFPFHFDHATSLSAGLSKLQAEPFDIVLLDLNLPDSRGLDTFYSVKQAFPQLPIVMLTGSDDDDIALRALKDGAQDYLVKGDLDIRILSRCILYAVERTKIISQREDFLAAIIHDVKNPLIGSDYIFDLMLNEKFGALQPELQEITSALKESNKTVLNLLKNLLEIYRYDQGGMTLNFEKVDLEQIITGAINELKPMAKAKKLDLDMSVKNKQVLSADSLALHRVFLNLIGNSIKFTPSGGRVAVVIDGEETAAVDISDTGQGISESQKDQLFQRFYRGDKSHDVGCGLGLFFCKQIIESHKGSIQCRSNPGAGTTFTVQLPKEQT